MIKKRNNFTFVLKEARKMPVFPALLFIHAWKMAFGWKLIAENRLWKKTEADRYGDIIVHDDKNNESCGNWLKVKDAIDELEKDFNKKLGERNK